jgi:hypothetical protein
MSDCERIPGTKCCPCTSPNVATQLLDSDAEEVLASCEGTEYECPDGVVEGAPCCSKCLSADVDTETFQGEPWEVGFADVSLITYNTTVNGAPYYILFTIYPGLDLSYVRIWWESDQDWPVPPIIQEWDDEFDYPGDGVVDAADFHVTGLPIRPNDTLSFEETTERRFGMIIDPAGMGEGVFTGRIVWRPYPVPPPDDEVDVPPNNPEDGNKRHVQVEVEPVSTDLSARFTTHSPLGFVCEAGDPPIERPFEFYRASGSTDLYWTLEWIPDETCPGTLSATSGGPLSDSDPHQETLTIDPATLADDTVYTGVIKLCGYSDAGFSDLTNEDLLGVQVRVGKDDIIFDVSREENPIRHHPFELTVIANDAGGVREEYDEEAGSRLNLNISCGYSPADEISPGSKDAAFEDGVCVLEGLRISGGTGPKNPVVQVADYETGVYGLATVPVRDLGNVAAVSIYFDATPYAPGIYKQAISYVPLSDVVYSGGGWGVWNPTVEIGRVKSDTVMPNGEVPEGTWYVTLGRSTYHIFYSGPMPGTTVDGVDCPEGDITFDWVGENPAVEGQIYTMIFRCRLAAFP